MKKIYSANQGIIVLKVTADTECTIKQSKMIQGTKLNQSQLPTIEHHIKIEMIDSSSNHRFVIVRIQLGENKTVAFSSGTHSPKEFKAIKLMADMIDDFLTRIIDMEQMNLIEFNEQEMINFLDHTMTESVFRLNQLDISSLQIAH